MTVEKLFLLTIADRLAKARDDQYSQSVELMQEIEDKKGRKTLASTVASAVRLRVSKDLGDLAEIFQEAARG